MVNILQVDGLARGARVDGLARGAKDCRDDKDSCRQRLSDATDVVVSTKIVVTTKTRVDKDCRDFVVSPKIVMTTKTTSVASSATKRSFNMEKGYQFWE